MKVTLLVWKRQTALLVIGTLFLTSVLLRAQTASEESDQLPYRFLLVISDQWDDPGSYILEGNNEFRLVAALLKAWGIPFDIRRLDQQRLDAYHLIDREGRSRYGTIIWDARLGEEREAEIEIVEHLIQEQTVNLVVLGDTLETARLSGLAGVEYISEFILPDNLSCNGDHFITRRLSRPCEAFLEEGEEYVPGYKVSADTARIVASRGASPFLTVRILRSGARVVWFGAHREALQITKPILRELLKRSLIWAQGYALYREYGRSALLEMHDMGTSDRTFLPYWHYPTLTEEEIREEIIKPLKRHDAVLNQVVNTGYVDRKTERILNPWTLEAIPDELDKTIFHDYVSCKRGLDAGLREGVFEIQSHGWTHMLPDLDSSPGPFWTAPVDGVASLNWYNEFADQLRGEDIPAATQRFHLLRSVEYIQQDFGVIPLFVRAGGGAYSVSSPAHTGRVAARIGFGLTRLAAPTYLGDDLIINLRPFVPSKSWAYDEEIKGADLSWSDDGPLFIYFHDRDVALDGQALQRLLTNLGEDVDYFSANEYCGYLHAQVRSSEAPNDALTLIVHYDDHYGQYFKTHASTWTLHLSDWRLESFGGRVPQRRVVTFPPGIGDHHLRLTKNGEIVTD